MKAKALFLSLLVALVLLVQSCSTLIPEASVTAAKTSIYGNDSWQDPIGFQAGVEAPVYSISEPLSVRAGAGLSLQGAKWEEASISGRTNLWYINIPLTLRYTSPGGFYGEAGLQPGLLISAKDKYNGTSESYMEYMNKLDIGLPLTAGYMFTNNIGVHFKVVPGLLNISKDSDIADRNILFGIGLTYKFGKK